MKDFKTFFEKESTYYIFCDMDGVLCNFDKQFEKYNDEHLNPDAFFEKYGKDAFVNVSGKAGVEFWSTMEWMPDGKELWEFIKPYNPTILSAPTKYESSKVGKLEWLKKNIQLPNYDIQTKAKKGWDDVSKIILNTDKFRYCKGSKDILIDDTAKKIDPWVKAGGVGILHTTAKNTIEKLNYFLNI